MAKKALSWQLTFTVALVIMILSAVSLLTYLNRVGRVAQEFSEDVACEQSINQIIVEKNLQLDIFGASRLRCATNYIDAEMKPERARQQIANEMASCWKKFKRGEQPLFDTEEGNYCVVCASLEYDQSVQIEGFSQYLIDTKIPTRKETYFQFLTNNNDPAVLEEFEGSNLAQQDTLNTGNALAVVFLMNQQVDDYTAWGSLIGVGVGIALAPFTFGTSLLAVGALGVAGGGAGYAIGHFASAENTQSSVLLWDYNKLSDLNCFQLEGRATSLEYIQ